MFSIYLPTVLNLNVILKVEEQVVGRHDASGKEILPDKIDRFICHI